MNVTFNSSLITCRLIVNPVVLWLYDTDTVSFKVSPCKCFIETEYWMYCHESGINRPGSAFSQSVMQA